MDISTTIAKINTVIDLANEFIKANAPAMLPENRTKLIDLATVSLMQFEDHVFHWDQLRNIVVEMVGQHEHGQIPWFIDIDRSTSGVVTVTNEATKQSIQINVAQLLLSTMLSVH